jgi:hypothetical protein
LYAVLGDGRIGGVDKEYSTRGIRKIRICDERRKERKEWEGSRGGFLK